MHALKHARAPMRAAPHRRCTPRCPTLPAARRHTTRIPRTTRPHASTPPDDAGWGAAPDRASLIWAAAKPPMYAVALIPVLVGGAAAAAATGTWAGPMLARAAAGACLIIGWLNLSNDAFDATTGVDASKRESVVALLGGRAGPVHVHVAAVAALVTGALLLRSAFAASANGLPARLLAAAVACGYVYQGPPFRLSYAGLGEPLAFAAFGPAATTAFYLAAAAAGGATSMCVTPAAAVSSSVVGATTATVLLCSHFHQVAGDTAAGKRSPVVRLGTRRAAAVVGAVVVCVHTLVVGAAALRLLPPAAALASLAAAPLGAALARRAAADHASPAAIRTLKADALKWHAVLGGGLAAALASAA